jgi:hypothetical protein
VPALLTTSASEFIGLLRSTVTAVLEMLYLDKRRMPPVDVFLAAVSVK